MFLFLFGCVSPSPHAFSSSKGINTVSTKLAADLYGHDLDDLRILSHCKLMPGAWQVDFDARAPRRDAGEPPLDT